MQLIVLMAVPDDYKQIMDDENLAKNIEEDIERRKDFPSPLRKII